MAEQNKGEETKTVSFRLTEETKEKFKEISAMNGCNQQETMQTLINAYYMQTQQAELFDYKADIERFQGYVTSLITMYTDSLQSNKDVREIVGQEYQTQITSKDKLIAELQQRAELAESQAEFHLNSATELKADYEKLERELYDLKSETSDRIADLNKSLSDKEQINVMLSDNCNTLKAELEKTVAEHTELINLREENKELINAKAELEKELEKANKELETELESLKQKFELETEKKLLETEKKHNAELKKFKEQSAKETESYRKAYLELLDKIGKGETETDTETVEKKRVKK